MEMQEVVDDVVAHPEDARTQSVFRFYELAKRAEKVFLMQVFYERLIIPRFRLIARSSRGTVLEDLCNRLTIDDGIHHGAGMAYEKVLLRDASKKTKDGMIKGASKMLPIFAQHVMWRPKARGFVSTSMRSRDVARVRREIEEGIKIASSLGLDV